MTGFDSKRKIALDRLDDDDVQVYAQTNLKGAEMTKDEALKLALEALDSKYILGCGEWRGQQNKAITAIKEALAQPEQEPVEVCCGDYYKCSKPCTLRGRYYGEKLTPKRTWVGLTDEQFTEAARLAEAGNYLVAFQRIQQWLKEGNT